MRANVKKVLEQVVEVLNRGDDDASDLCFLLSALRGPDTNDVTLKIETTARLRYAIGLRPSDRYSSQYSACGMRLSTAPLQSTEAADKLLEREASVGNYHFGLHFKLAVRAFHKAEE